MAIDFNGTLPQKIMLPPTHKLTRIWKTTFIQKSDTLRVYLELDLGDDKGVVIFCLNKTASNTYSYISYDTYYIYI